MNTEYEKYRIVESMEPCIHIFNLPVEDGMISHYCEIFGHSCGILNYLTCIYYHDKESRLMNLLNEKARALKVQIEAEKRRDNPDKKTIRILEKEYRDTMNVLEKRDMRR